jgi:Tfp pilus assembly protein PilV
MDLATQRLITSLGVDASGKTVKQDWTRCMHILKVPGTARFRPEKATAFTLMEVVVAVLVLTTISTAFYLGLSTCFSVLKTSREDIRATQIMMQKLEAVRLCTWSELTNFSFKEPYDPNTANTNSSGVYFYGTVAKGAIGFPSGVSYSNNMCVVTVNLSWTNKAGTVPHAYNRQMQTYYARYGLQSYIWGAIQ